MPSRGWQQRVQDILAAIAEIKAFTQGMIYDEFQADSRTIRAVLYDLAIIGEVARVIPPEVEASHPESPWYDIRGMRNIVIHEYFQVDLPIIWQTIQEDLVPLVEPLSRLLENKSEY